MHRRLNWLLLSLMAVTGFSAPAWTDPRTTTDVTSPVVAHHPALRASLDRIASGSRLWRDAVDALTGSGRRAIVLTPDQVKVRERRDGAIGTFDPDILGEASPIVVSESEVPVVLVVVNLPLLHRMHHAQPSSLPADFERDLDRIVIHEVYGHAFPYLLAGNVSGRCADAVAGQRAVDACAIQRENAVRAELRLGIRRDAGVDALTLTQRVLARPTPRWDPARLR